MSGWIVAAAVAPVVGCVLEFLRITLVADGTPPWSLGFVIGATAAVFAAGMAAAFLAVMNGPDDRALARDIDRRLGLGDRAATALAIARGETRGALAPVVLAESAPAFAAAMPRVEPEFAVGPQTRIVRRVTFACWMLWALLAFLIVVDLLRLLDWPFGLLAPGPRDVGLISAPADPDAKAPMTPKGTPKAGGDADPPPLTPPAPDDPKTPETDRPERPGEKPKEPDGDPGVTATARPSHEKFDAKEPVHVVLWATPTRASAADRTFTASLDVDGTTVPGGVTLTIGPSSPAGASSIVDLRRYPGLAEKLRPGEHQVTLRLRDDQTGAEVASAPAPFRIEGDDPGPQSPPPSPQAGPKPPSPPEPPPEAPPPPPQGTNPPPLAKDGAPPPPDVEVAFDPRVVVPLFGPGEEVVKRGPRVSLAPGEAPTSAPPLRAPVAPRIDDAARRAESFVDRPGVRPSDRDLVRRYFEELRKGAK